MNMEKYILQMEGITKGFPGVKALDGVDLKLKEGSVMALLGENGAGKSTLMKILSGVYTKDSGTIFFEGQNLEVKNPRDAQEKGIAIIHQELNLIPQLSIGENIFLGREPLKVGGLIDWKKLYEDSQKLIAQLGLEYSPKKLVEDLSVAEQQLVEVAKALSMDSKVIIMDEPTDALMDAEVERLFSIIKKLKSENKSVVFISHRLKEIFEICDEVTIIRDGKYVGSKLVEEITEDQIIEMMVGRKLTEQFPRVEVEAGKMMLEVKNLKNKYLKDISFDLKEGEILGIAGLVGSKRTELAKTLYGVYHKESGNVILDGKEINPKTPKEALDSGIVYISEDRKQEGLILELSIRENMTISSLDTFKKSFGMIDKSKEEKTVQTYISKMSIKTPTMNQLIKNLSGGNQQKVAIAKGLMRNPKVLILDEPTRGVDVGAKKEIYELINELKKEGKSIIVISSEMPEILGISDRIIVMHEGSLKGILYTKDASQEKIMGCALQ